MKCETLEIECFFTELEKIKPKIDKVIDKIDWTALSREIALDKAVMQEYKDWLDWKVIGRRLFTSDKSDLFSFWVNAGKINISDYYNIIPSFEILQRHFDDLLPIDIFEYYTEENEDEIVKILERMIGDKRYTDEFLVNNFLESSIKWQSLKVIDLMFYAYGSTISKRFWEIADNKISKSCFDTWMSRREIANNFNPNNEQHRKLILSKGDFQSYPEYFFMCKWTTKELLEYKHIKCFKQLFFWVFTRRYSKCKNI